MKSFAATVLLASQASALYWVENKYTLMGNGQPIFTGSSRSTNNSNNLSEDDSKTQKMELAVTHWQNEKNEYMIQMCTCFEVDMATDSNY